MIDDLLTNKCVRPIVTIHPKSPAYSLLGSKEINWRSSTLCRLIYRAKERHLYQI